MLQEIVCTNWFVWIYLFKTVTSFFTKEMKAVVRDHILAVGISLVFTQIKPYLIGNKTYRNNKKAW